MITKASFTTRKSKVRFIMIFCQDNQYQPFGSKLVNLINFVTIQQTSSQV